eukprot:40555-Chlamydomonas_euryale.AAC.11
MHSEPYVTLRANLMCNGVMQELLLEDIFVPKDVHEKDVQNKMCTKRMMSYRAAHLDVLDFCARDDVLRRGRLCLTCR